MLKLKAIYTPQVWKTASHVTPGGFVDGEPETVMVIQVTQFSGLAASVIFVDSQGNVKEDKIDRFSNVEGVWR